MKNLEIQISHFGDFFPYVLYTYFITYTSLGDFWGDFSYNFGS